MHVRKSTSIVTTHKTVSAITCAIQKTVYFVTMATTHKTVNIAIMSGEMRKILWTGQQYDVMLVLFMSVPKHVLM